jgi:flavorubredoxin
VVVLYASAYGNTASMAQTISRGITKAGVGVEMVNLEQVPPDEAEAALHGAQGFCIGGRPVCALLFAQTCKPGPKT